MIIYPIPPGLYCVPAALCALTGEPLDAVIVPALNRHLRTWGLASTVGGVHTWVTGVAVLKELGWRVRNYRTDAAAGSKRARLNTWARRSRERWPGRALLLTADGHCVVMRDGVIYDNWVPYGAPGEQHPYASARVNGAALVERATPPIYNGEADRGQRKAS